MVKNCKYCNAPLVRKRYGKKRGNLKNLESLVDFTKRGYCNKSCATTYRHVSRRGFVWSKTKVLSLFKSIKSENKYNSAWLAKNETALYKAICDLYGKRAWLKFIRSLGLQPLRNEIDQKHKRIARKWIFYQKKEHGYNPGDIIYYSTKWGLPGISEPWQTFYKALIYLEDMQVIKRLSIGDKYGGGSGSKSISCYKLLKTRV